MPRKPKRPIQGGLWGIFEERVKQGYRNMFNRLVAERRNDSGKITRFGSTLPFSEEKFRQFVLNVFGGNPDSIARCAYCQRPINVKTFVADHDVPVKLGGSLDLDNIKLCCEECNLIKGATRGENFIRFYDWCMYNLPEDERRDVFGRMKNGGGYLRMKWKLKPKKAKVSASGGLFRRR